MGIRLASYNIHACIGMDGHYDPARIRDVMHEIDADVIALQEVEQLKDSPELLPFLCEGSDWVAHAGPTMMREQGEYGNAVLTRLPVQDLERIELSQSGREPRGALRLSMLSGLEADAEPLDVYATHLGLRPGERRRQIRQLLEHMTARGHQEQGQALCVLMGDLNEWYLWGRPIRWLRRHFNTATAPRTFPSRWPLFALDRIWAKPSSRIKSVRTWRSELSRVASDHLPLVMELD